MAQSIYRPGGTPTPLRPTPIIPAEERGLADKFPVTQPRKNVRPPARLGVAIVRTVKSTVIKPPLPRGMQTGPLSDPRAPRTTRPYELWAGVSPADLWEYRSPRKTVNAALAPTKSGVMQFLPDGTPGGLREVTSGTGANRGYGLIERQLTRLSRPVRADVLTVIKAARRELKKPITYGKGGTIKQALDRVRLESPYVTTTRGAPRPDPIKGTIRNRIMGGWVGNDAHTKMAPPEIAARMAALRQRRNPAPRAGDVATPGQWSGNANAGAIAVEPTRYVTALDELTQPKSKDQAVSAAVDLAHQAISTSSTNPATSPAFGGWLTFGVVALLAIMVLHR